MDPGVHAYNGGQSGATSATYADATRISLVIAKAPLVVLHMIGSNDYRESVRVGDYKANIVTCINRIKRGHTAPHVHVLVHSYQRTDFDAAWAIAPWSEYGNALREIAEEAPDTVAFLDLSKSYALAGVPGADPLEFVSSDRVHQTPAGHEFMADQLRLKLNIDAVSTVSISQRSDHPSALRAAGVTGPWDDTLSVFNFKPSNTRRLRARRAGAIAGTSLFKVAVGGDSTEAGYQVDYATQSPIAVAAKRLITAGVPTAGDLVAANKGGVFFSPDARWTYSGKWIGSEGKHHATAAEAGATATYSSTNKGTILELAYRNGIGPFTYSVDEGAAVAVTPTGTNGLSTIAVGGLPNAVHKIKVTTSSASPVTLIHATVRFPTGLYAGNFGVNSSTGWHWKDTGADSPGQVVGSWLPAVFILALGINDYAQGITPTEFKKWLRDSLNRVNGAFCDRIIATSNNVDNADYAEYNKAKYELAAELDIPLVDVGSVMGTYAQASELGLMYEQVHPNVAGYAMKGDLYARILSS